jgi:2-keto-4-pentenoate hydratase/2-oxohepta-3-ene-1,7-dioic acid hydratase in catechol pathway
MWMKIARFRTGRRVAYGVVKGEEVIEIRGGIYAKFRMTDTKYRLSNVKLLPPTEAIELWGPGLNFADHLEFAGTVLGREMPRAPKHPQPWRKGRNSLTGYNDPIIIPKDSTGEVHYEGEAVAVIGKDCRRVTPKEAPRFILGYTCGNDVSERGWQKDDWSFWRAKGSDTFAPVGPWIETDVDPQNLELIVRVNEEEVQRCNTRDMLFTFAEIVSYISQQVTLRPGDLVFSGANGVTRAIKPGDVVEVEIPGIGVLSNPVEAEFDSSAYWDDDA